MTNGEVEMIVFDAYFLRLEGVERARYILGRGVTLEEYERFERRRTIRWIATCFVLTVAAIAISLYLTGRAGD